MLARLTSALNRALRHNGKRHGRIHARKLAARARGRAHRVVAAAESRGCHQGQGAKAGRLFRGDTGKKFGRQRQPERVDRRVAMVFRDHVEHVAHGVAEQLDVVRTVRPVRKAVPGQIRCIDASAVPRMIEGRLHLADRSGRVDAVQQQQRLSGARHVVTEPAAAASCLEALGSDGRRQSEVGHGQHRSVSCVPSLLEMRSSIRQPTVPRSQSGAHRTRPSGAGCPRSCARSCRGSSAAR